MAYDAPSERVGFDLAAAPLYSIVISVDSPSRGYSSVGRASRSQKDRAIVDSKGLIWTEWDESLH